MAPLAKVQHAFSGKCPCGKFAVTLSPRDGQELKVGYCHCFSCRRFFSAPVSASRSAGAAETVLGATQQGAH